MGISIRAYAASRKERGLSGGSDAAVRKAITTGRIKKLKDGTIDPSAADIAWGGSTDTAKLRGDLPPGKKGKGKDDYRYEDDEDRPTIIASPTAGMDEKAATTFNDIRVRREFVKLKKELREEKLAENTVIVKEPARRMVFAMAKTYSSGLRSHHSIAGARLAAKYKDGIKNPHEFIQDLRAEYDKYLEDMSKEKIDIAPDQEAK